LNRGTLEVPGVPVVVLVVPVAPVVLRLVTGVVAVVFEGRRPPMVVMLPERVSVVPLLLVGAGPDIALLPPRAVVLFVPLLVPLRVPLLVPLERVFPFVLRPLTVLVPPAGATGAVTVWVWFVAPVCPP